MIDYLGHLWNAQIAWLCDPLLWIVFIPACLMARYLVPKDENVLILKAWIPYLTLDVVLMTLSMYGIFVRNW